jgi:hypothetical protein
MIVTVTDKKGNTASNGLGYFIHKDVEATNLSSPGYRTKINGKFVTSSQTGPMGHPPSAISFTSTKTVSCAEGLTITAGESISIPEVATVKEDVSATTTTTFTSATGETHTFTLNPGETAAMWESCCVIKRDGGWTTYDCNGIKGTGTWEDVKMDDPDTNYSLKDCN